MTSYTTISPSEFAFDSFFEMGQPTSKSPFLTPRSRQWAHNLPLKAALLAGILLAVAFWLSFYSALQPFSYLALVFVYFLAGTPALIESIEDLLEYDVNIDVLMTLAAYSSIFIGSEMEGGLLLVLFAISGAMEEAVETKAKGAISSLHKLTPSKGVVMEDDGTLIERALADIPVGSRILVRSGEIIPLDGVVLEGASFINLVHLTGESVPVAKKTHDTVPAGALNTEGTLTIQVTHISSDSTLSRIINLVTQAQDSKPKLQRWFDYLSRPYAITIILLSVLFAVSLPHLLGIPYLGEEGSLYRALAFLIAASPCALIIALPIAYLSAIGACAKQGILLKGGISLDALASCKSIAFDKTGTLTTGELECFGISTAVPSNITIETALSIAHALERNAVHPVAKAIVHYCVNQNIPPTKITDFKTVPGFGVEGVYDSTPVYLGNLAFLEGKASNELFTLLSTKSFEIQSEGHLLTFLLIGGSAFIFTFGDQLRPHIADSLMPLAKKYKLNLLMLTGDHASNAKRVADEVGLNNFYADLRPEDKLQIVTSLSHKEGLAMVGDGINDAPALARATVGIGMGKVGSATAIEAADIVLLHDSIDKLDWLVGKAHQTKRIVKQNLSLAIAAIFFASLPALAGIVPLWMAVIMHEGGTVLVGLNGLRLLSSSSNRT